MNSQLSGLLLAAGLIIIAGLLVATRKVWWGAWVHGVPSVWRIAKMTVAEAQRRRVLHALVLVVILIMASISLIRYLSPAEQARMVKDSGLTAITVFGMIISIFVVSFMIPHEIESRTIYPVLAKPVRRYEFLLGKYVGALVILGAIVVALTAVLVGVLALEAHFVPPVADSVFDPTLAGVVSAAAMTYVALAVLTALIMLISSVASTTMTVISAFLLWFLGSMQAQIEELVTKTVGVSHYLLYLFSHAVPPLQNFDFRPNVLNGDPIIGSAVVDALGKGLLYAVVALVFASLFIENREV